MAKTTQISTQATEAEIEALKEATGKTSIKDALEDAMQYRIAHPVGGKCPICDGKKIESKQTTGKQEAK